MKITDLSVLILEDDDFQRNIIADMASALGIASIFSASNGRQALEIVHGANSKPLDVVLCDLNMPEMDGMEFLRHLGEEHQNVAVILISSLDGKLLSSVGRMAQMYGIQLLGVIEKPVVLVNLKEHLLKLGNSAAKVKQSP